jgi:hypothetical protein
MRALQAVLQIREFSTGGPFDDQQDIDFTNLALIKPALPQLSPDPADWLPPSVRQGTRSTISFSAGAGQVQGREHAVGCADVGTAKVTPRLRLQCRFTCLVRL